MNYAPQAPRNVVKFDSIIYSGSFKDNILQFLQQKPQ